jgi:ABC-type transport system involved in multi-copper enzyme maturation permease subunit
MFWTITKKELLSNILTYRFIIGTLLLLVLVILFTFILLDEYSQNVEEYSKLLSKNEESMARTMTYQNLKPFIHRSPEVLTIFSKGIDDNVAKSAQISIEEIPFLKSTSRSKNPLLSVFAVLDVALIFKLIISVLAFLFAYDAISGEKESGTLRMILANSVLRYQLVLGKFIGGMFTLAIPIAMGFVVTSLILEFSPITNLSGDEWGRIFCMFLSSLLLVGVLFSIGLLASSMTKRSAITLMFLLFVWITFLLILPNTSSYLAIRLKPTESLRNINSQIQNVEENLRKEIYQIYFNTPEEGEYNAQSDREEPGGYYIQFATRGALRYHQSIHKQMVPLCLKAAEDIWNINRQYIDSLNRQKILASWIAKISPIFLYERIMNSLSRTNYSNLANFSDQARRYRQQLIDFLGSKNAFSSLRYFTVMEKEPDFEVSDDGEYYEMLKKYAEFEPDPLDISDVPRFRYQRESVATSFMKLLPDLVILLFMGIFFFACALVAVLKYDVR